MLRSKLAAGAHCALEHGGVAPVIVDKDVDIDPIIPSLSKGGFYHAGQVCVSIQRLYVHQNKIDELVSKLTPVVENLRVGDPLDPKTEVGPLISPHEIDRIHQWVTDAIDKGGKLLCGGKKLPNNCYSPTLILNPPGSAILSQNEIFGPVVAIYSVPDIDTAIAKANALPFCFQAAMFTDNLHHALKAGKQLNATAVMINDHSAFRVDWMPFGGRMQSGLGMGGIPYSMHDMSYEKMMVIKSPEL